MSTKQRKIAEAARKHPGESLVSIARHIDVEWLYCAYELVRRDGARGIDGAGAEAYGQNLWENLTNLLDRFKSGLYRAPAVKRVYIPKAGSTEKRPIGIPAYEDKILQRAVQMALERIYEGEFYDVSYGFRPGKSAHQALERLWKESMNVRGGYIIDMDISTCFDTIPHESLREILGQRVRDGVIQRAIGKWLNAGVMEQGKRIMKVLALRFAKYGLTTHPEKTRLIDFTEPEGGTGKGSFTFMGFTRYWMKSKKGRWIVGRKTEKKRLRGSIQAITQWCRENRHKPVKEQHEKLTAKLRGHYAYYGITMNFKSLERFFLKIREIWFKWLNRRSDKRSLYWWQYLMYLKGHPLPYPRIVHSYV